MLTDIQQEELTIYNVAEASELLRMSKGKVYEMIKYGQLSAYKIGKGYGIPLSSIRQFIQQHIS